MHVVTLKIRRLVHEEDFLFSIGSLLVPDGSKFDQKQVPALFKQWKSTFPEKAVGYFAMWIVEQYPELKIVDVEYAYITC